MQTFKLPDDIDINDWYGFVYRITNVRTGKRYIGMKSFWTFRVPKGKTNKKKYESNWKKYRSSSKAVKEWDKEDCSYVILYLCKDKPIMKYIEAKEQMKHEVMESEDWLNDNIRITLMTKMNNIEERTKCLTN